MEMKLKIENEEDIKRNEEEKRKPHELLRMQQCMLWDQMENPDLNVHNLTRLYRYDKSNLNIEKFMNSLNKVIRHHPTYLMSWNLKKKYIRIYYMIFSIIYMINC